MLLFFALTYSISFSQKHAESPVYKDYKYKDSSTIFKRVDDSFKLWQSYLLIKEANEGNPFAEHELGLRYLLGKGFPADTLKGFTWIKKASDKNLITANYNIGILYHNGWGTEWNPFEAYKNFKKAADENMPEALYIIGLTYTDNLILPRNTEKAYLYLKKSADRNYQPAKDVLKEFRKKGMFFVSDSIDLSEDNKATIIDTSELVDPAAGLTYLDPIDSVMQNDDISLLNDLLKSGTKELQKTLGIKVVNDSTFSLDSTALGLIKTSADNGSPEAIILLGKCYEKGIGVKQDLITASAQYIRAIRLDSPHGPKLLTDLLKQPLFNRQLRIRTQQKNAEAEFVTAGLTTLEFDSKLFANDVIKLLLDASDKKYIPALIELGLCYYSGNLVEQDKEKAIQVWKKAAELNNYEARVRIAVANMQTGFTYDKAENSFNVLDNASARGNLLAQVALAYCYESGKGVERNLSEAANLYRTAASRGSQGAYNSLKRIYDQIRPNQEEFIILE